MIQVPLLNEGFDVNPREAGLMWAEGVSLGPDLPGEYCPSPARVRKTSDNKWLVRRRVLGTTQELERAGDIASTALEEFRQLQQFGVDVISRAITASVGGKSIITISPLVGGLVPCSRETYKSTLLIKVRNYYAESIGRAALDDIDGPRQYSHLHSEEQPPFLHDVDPYIDLRAL